MSIKKVFSTTAEVRIEDLPAVTDHDLGGVFVGHDGGGPWESAASGVGVVALKGLPGHACVQVGANLERVPKTSQVNNKQRLRRKTVQPQNTGCKSRGVSCLSGTY